MARLVLATRRGPAGRGRAGVLSLVALATALAGTCGGLGKRGLSQRGSVIGGPGIAKYSGNICAKGSQEKRLQGLGAPRRGVPRPWKPIR
jgi:hypothetical protein